MLYGDVPQTILLFPPCSYGKHRQTFCNLQVVNNIPNPLSTPFSGITGQLLIRYTIVEEIISTAKSDAKTKKASVSVLSRVLA